MYVFYTRVEDSMVIIHSMEGARERGEATGRRENALRNTRERAAALSLGRPPAEGLGGGPMNARCCPALPCPGLACVEHTEDSTYTVECRILARCGGAIDGAPG